MFGKYTEIEKNFSENNGNSFLTSDQVLKVMELEQLERIASILEDINSTLINMSELTDQLTECIGVHPIRPYQERPTYYLRIAGEVSTD